MKRRIDNMTYHVQRYLKRVIARKDVPVRFIDHPQAAVLVDTDKKEPLKIDGEYQMQLPLSRRSLTYLFGPEIAEQITDETWYTLIIALLYHEVGHLISGEGWTDGTQLWKELQNYINDCNEETVIPREWVGSRKFIRELNYFVKMLDEGIDRYYPKEDTPMEWLTLLVQAVRKYRFHLAFKLEGEWVDEFDPNTTPIHDAFEDIKKIIHDARSFDSPKHEILSKKRQGLTQEVYDRLKKWWVDEMGLPEETFDPEPPPPPPQPGGDGEEGDEGEGNDQQESDSSSSSSPDDGEDSDQKENGSSSGEGDSDDEDSDEEGDESGNGSGDDSDDEEGSEGSSNGNDDSDGDEDESNGSSTGDGDEDSDSNCSGEGGGSGDGSQGDQQQSGDGGSSGGEQPEQYESPDNMLGGLNALDIDTSDLEELLKKLQEIAETSELSPTSADLRKSVRAEAREKKAAEEEEEKEFGEQMGKWDQSETDGITPNYHGEGYSPPPPVRAYTTLQVDNGSIAKLRMQLRRLMQARKLAARKPVRRGEHLYPPNFYQIKTDPKRAQVMADETDIETTIDKARVALLFDSSGSMGGDKHKIAMQTMAIIQQAAATIKDLEIDLIGFCDPWNSGKKVDQAKIHKNKERTFAEIEAILEPRGGTNMPYSMKSVVDMMIKAKEERKYILILTDGDFTGHGRAGNISFTDPTEPYRWAKMNGIKVMAFGVGTAPDKAPPGYFDSYEYLMDETEVPRVFKNLVKRVVR